MAFVLTIIDGIQIPSSEIEILTSRAGGPGGQHVNTSDTRITVRWNARLTQIFAAEQKEYLLERLAAQLTDDGCLVIHNSESRSQNSNKKKALEKLASLIRQALIIPKKRRRSKIPAAVTQARLREKALRSRIKQERRSSSHGDD